MARQGGWAQFGQSDMRLALDMANMAKGRFSQAAMEEAQEPIHEPPAEDREEMKPVVQSHGHYKVKVVIESHLAMVCENQMDGCL
jgi:hypothetical protein